jgi:hypothetical protein
MDDAELAALYDAGGYEAAAEILAECERRDRAARVAPAQAARGRLHAEWYDAAYADFIAASAACGGGLMVNAEGVKAGIGEDFRLWSGGNDEWALRYCTDEVRDWWLDHPRLTFDRWLKTRAKASRTAREEAAMTDDTGWDIPAAWAEATGTEINELSDITEVTGDEYIAAVAEEVIGACSPAVDGHEAAPVRHIGEGPAADTVRGAGRGRDGGSVRPAGRMMISFDQVPPQDTMLLSQRPYLPYGEVSLVYGEGSLGKGRMVQSIIAAVTNGQPVGLDESTEDEAGDVIVILPEDKQGESAVKRLIAAGANLHRVWDLTRTSSGERFKLSATPRHPGHMPELRAAIKELREAGRNPRMIVIDPLGACIGEGTILTSKGARHLVESLQDLAEQTGMCLLVVAHPVTGGKLQGSWALQQALRSVFYVRRDENDPDLRLLANVKGNDVPPDLAGDIPFTIVDDAERGPRAVWIGAKAPEAAKVPQRGGDWRDELASRRAAKSAPAQAAPPPAGRVPTVPFPAVTYSAGIAANGVRRPLASGITSLELAQAMCAATDEARMLGGLTWVQRDAQTWQAGNSAVAFAVIAAGAREQAG